MSSAGYGTGEKMVAGMEGRLEQKATRSKSTAAACKLSSTTRGKLGPAVSTEDALAGDAMDMVAAAGSSVGGVRQAFDSRRLAEGIIKTSIQGGFYISQHLQWLSGDLNIDMSCVGHEIRRLYRYQIHHQIEGYAVIGWVHLHYPLEWLQHLSTEQAIEGIHHGVG
jgi:hypothetical protein